MIDGTSKSVWQRTGEGPLSMNLFAGLVCFWTMVGIGSSAVAALVSQHWQISLLPMLGLFVVSVVGVIIALKSDNPVISFLGYMLVAVPMGLIIGPVINIYTPASVAKVLMITTGLVAALGIVGAAWPRSLEHWGIYLFGALVVLILGQFITAIAGAFGANVRGTMHFWDWAGVFLFSAYVIFDLNRAMRVERTHDNAIDCAVAVYLDFANLFMRLMSLFGVRKSD